MVSLQYTIFALSYRPYLVQYMYKLWKQIIYDK